MLLLCLKSVPFFTAQRAIMLNPSFPYILQIEAMRKDGKFLARDGSSVPEGQAIVNSNLAEAYEILQVCLSQ